MKYEFHLSIKRSIVLIKKTTKYEREIYSKMVNKKFKK